MGIFTVAAWLIYSSVRGLFNFLPNPIEEPTNFMFYDRMHHVALETNLSVKYVENKKGKYVFRQN